MIFAILDEKKIEPVPNTSAFCPLCNKEVFSRCGEIKIWHWAHPRDSSCDSWHEPETLWHINWKMTFGKENSEVVIKKEDKWHIADVLTKKASSLNYKTLQFKRRLFLKEKDFIIKYGGDYLKHLRLFRNLTIELNIKKLKLRGVDYPTEQ